METIPLLVQVTTGRVRVSQRTDGDYGCLKAARATGNAGENEMGEVMETAAKPNPLPSANCADDLPDEPISDDAWPEDPVGSFARLLNAARGGESESASRLLERFMRYLTWVAETETDPRLRAKLGISDLVQETLLDAHCSMGQFHGTTARQFAAWLRRILGNNSADGGRHFRGAEMREVGREVPLRQSRLRNGKRAVSDETPSRRMMRQERDVALERAIASLPEHYRRAIALRHWSGLPFDRIGTEMGVSGAAARKVWCRAVKALERVLGDERDD